MASILILLHIESIQRCIGIQAQSFLLGMNLLGKSPRCLNIAVMSKELEDLKLLDRFFAGANTERTSD
jgi:hypothetical protein